ncbi:hypothetical protein [Bacillus sp. FJAT-27225]|nr:hypothetical protein [Bacillus sp. FJAT-27225]
MYKAVFFLFFLIVFLTAFVFTNMKNSFYTFLF